MSLIILPSVPDRNECFSPIAELRLELCGDVAATGPGPHLLPLVTIGDVR